MKTKPKYNNSRVTHNPYEPSFLWNMKAQNINWDADMINIVFFLKQWYYS